MPETFFFVFFKENCSCIVNNPCTYDVKVYFSVNRVKFDFRSRLIDKTFAGYVALVSAVMNLGVP